MMHRRLGLIILLAGVTLQPCTIAPSRRLWAKNTGSRSGLFAFEKNGKVGFIDSSGRVVIKPDIPAAIEDVGDFSDGRARVDGQGYLDESGKFAIKKGFRYQADFSDGLARVTLGEKEFAGTTLEHFIDTTGQIVTQVPAFRTSDFSDGLAEYEGEHKPGVRRFDGPNFLYRDYRGLRGFMDRTGKVVIEPRFASVGSFHHGLARAVVDGYCHVSLPEGGEVGSPTTGDASSCGGAPPDAVHACRVGFIARDGQFAIPPSFDSAFDFQEGLAAVRIDGRWGYIDANGTFIIARQFEMARPFREGLAAVMIGRKWGFIDRSGKWVIPPKFEQVEDFSDSMAVMTSGKRISYIDRTGQVRITGEFREVTPFVNGLAAVRLSETRVAYIDHQGRTVFEYQRKPERQSKGGN